MRLRRKLPLILGAVSIATFLSISSIIGISGVRLIKNFSPSERKGFYMVSPAKKLGRGELILLSFPKTLKPFAEVTAWLNESHPLLKRVAALPGDFVCHKADELEINGVAIAPIYSNDRLGNPLPHISGCYTVREGYFLPLNTYNPMSFDGRYFGELEKSSVLGTVRPILTF